MSTPYPPGQDDNAPGGGETPLDLLINAISDPADQDGEPGGVASHAYEDAGGFGLVNVGYDGQERPSDMREKEGADRDNGPMTLQQPVSINIWGF